MFHANAIKAAQDNENFRKVLFTGDHTQLVVMTLQVGEDIGMETHHGNDQILLFVEGTAHVVVGDDEVDVSEHDIVAVPAGKNHNVTNSSDKLLKLITIYGPADHKPGTIHVTKADAQEDEGTAEQ
jgi:mannose-6-phosphate isomerase-like protein (cupin superfamily)